MTPRHSGHDLRDLEMDIFFCWQSWGNLGVLLLLKIVLGYWNPGTCMPSWKLWFAEDAWKKNKNTLPNGGEKWWWIPWYSPSRINNSTNIYSFFDSGWKNSGFGREVAMKKRSTIKPKFWSFLFAEEKQGTRYPPGNVREEPYPTIHGKFGKSSTQVGAGSKKGDMDSKPRRLYDTNPNFMHFYKGNPSKLSDICCQHLIPPIDGVAFNDPWEVSAPPQKKVGEHLQLYLLNGLKKFEACRELIFFNQKLRNSVKSESTYRNPSP